MKNILIILLLLPVVVFGQKRVDQLPAIASPADTDVAVTVRSGSFYQTTFANLKTYFNDSTLDSLVVSNDTIYAYMPGGGNVFAVLPDASITNEIQTISIDSTDTSFTISLSNSGGSVTFTDTEGSASGGGFPIDTLAQDTLQESVSNTGNKEKLLPTWNGSLWYTDADGNAVNLTARQPIPIGKKYAWVRLEIGQSVIAGRADNDSLPANLLAEQDNAFVWDRQAGVVVKMDQSNDIPNSGQSGQHGFEPYWVEWRDSIAPEMPLYFAKTAIGGTAATLWTEQGLDMMLNGYAKPLINTLLSDGITPFVSIRWQQGEGNNGEETAVYEARLDTFIQRVQHDLPNIPIVFATLMGDGEGPAFTRAKINQAFRNVAERYSNVVYIDLRGIETSDGTHPTHNGNREAVRREVLALQSTGLWGHPVTQPFGYVPEYSFEGYEIGDTIRRELEPWNGKVVVVDTLNSQRVEIQASDFKRGYDLDSYTARFGNLFYSMETLKQDTVVIDFDYIETADVENGVYLNLIPYDDSGSFDQRPNGLNLTFRNDSVFCYRINQGNKEQTLINSGTLDFTDNTEYRLRVRRERYGKVRLYTSTDGGETFTQAFVSDQTGGSSSSGSFALWRAKDGSGSVFYDDFDITYNHHDPVFYSPDVWSYELAKNASGSEGEAFANPLLESFEVQAQANGDLFKVTNEARAAQNDVVTINDDGSTTDFTFNGYPDEAQITLTEGGANRIRITSDLDGADPGIQSIGKDIVAGLPSGKNFRPNLSTGDNDLGEGGRPWGEMWLRYAIQQPSGTSNNMVFDFGNTRDDGASNKSMWIVKGPSAYTSTHYMTISDGTNSLFTVGPSGHVGIGLGGTESLPTSPSSALDVSGDIELTGNIVLDSGNNVIIASGSGTPEGNLTAGIGSTYHRTDGGAGTSFYVKESGTGNTGWVAK